MTKGKSIGWVVGLPTELVNGTDIGFRVKGGRGEIISLLLSMLSLRVL